MSSSLGPSIPESDRKKARERAKEDRRQEQDETTARSIAQSAAAQQGTAKPGYWQMIGDPDIDHPDWEDNLEAFAKGELSSTFALGNITRKEYHNMELRIENEFWQMQNEMKGPDTSLTDSDMRMLYGEERPDLDDAQARRLRSAREVKKMNTSLSVDNRGLKAGTEIHAVAMTEDSKGGDEEEGGLIAGARNYFSG